MDKIESIKRIKDHVEHHQKKEPYTVGFPIYKALDMAIEALEKQKPKRVKIEKSTEGWGIEITAECPECGNDLSGEMNFCTVCGQCLLWEEV
jgi:hypothetical protein